MKVAKYTRPLSVVVTPDVFGKIESMSIAYHTSIGEIVRGILDEYVEREFKDELQPKPNEVDDLEDSLGFNADVLLKE